jgi:hypothetical protein
VIDGYGAVGDPAATDSSSKHKVADKKSSEWPNAGWHVAPVKRSLMLLAQDGWWGGTMFGAEDGWVQQVRGRRGELTVCKGWWNRPCGRLAVFLQATSNN